MGLLAILGVVLVGFVLASKSGGVTGGPLAIGHRYKFTFRDSSVRKGSGTDALANLTDRLKQLGWSTVLLEPSDADTDPFVWRATGIWSGNPPTLHDGLGISFIGQPTNVDAIPQAHKYDANLPPDLELTVDRMLASENDPNELRTFASSLRPEYPIAAANLETKANALSTGQAPPPPPPPAPVYVPPQPPPQVAPPAPPVAIEFPATPPPPPAVPFMPPPIDMSQILQTGPGAFTLPTQDLTAAPPTPQQAAEDAWTPGNLPALPPIPGHLRTSRPETKKEQAALLAWTNDTGQGIYLPNDVDGMVGPRTQRQTQIFQAWSNQFRGTQLGLDGLFGPNTNAALAEWGG